MRFNLFKLEFLSRDKLNEFIIYSYFMILRQVGFCLDKIDKETNNDKEFIEFNFPTMIWYSYYPIFIYVAPFISFKNFILCVSL